MAGFPSKDDVMPSETSCPGGLLIGCQRTKWTEFHDYRTFINGVTVVFFIQTGSEATCWHVTHLLSDTMVYMDYV